MASASTAHRDVQFHGNINSCVPVMLSPKDPTSTLIVL